MQRICRSHREHPEQRRIPGPLAQFSITCRSMSVLGHKWFWKEVGSGLKEVYNSVAIGDYIADCAPLCHGMTTSTVARPHRLLAGHLSSMIETQPVDEVDGCNHRG
nr:hypothetical protein CFP56_60770 [Quercus suber]